MDQKESVDLPGHFRRRVFGWLVCFRLLVEPSESFPRLVVLALISI